LDFNLISFLLQPFCAALKIGQEYLSIVSCL